MNTNYIRNQTHDMDFHDATAAFSNFQDTVNVLLYFTVQDNIHRRAANGTHIRHKLTSNVTNLLSSPEMKKTENYKSSVKFHCRQENAHNRTCVNYYFTRNL